MFCHGCGDEIESSSAHWHSGEGYCEGCEVIPAESDGIDKLRHMRNLFDNCSETFNQQWSVPQLEKIYDAYHACGYDITPDEWTMDQVLAALRGTVPTFGDK